MSQIRKACTRHPTLKRDNCKNQLPKYTAMSSLILIFIFGIKFRKKWCVTHYIIFFIYFSIFLSKNFFLKNIFDRKKFQNFFQNFRKFSKFFINLYIFHEIPKLLIKNTPVKTMKRTNFIKKIINFDVKQKKNSPAASPLIGNLLKWRAVSDDPLRGGFRASKKHQIVIKSS